MYTHYIYALHNTLYIYCYSRDRRRPECEVMAALPSHSCYFRSVDVAAFVHRQSVAAANATMQAGLPFVRCCRQRDKDDT